MKTNTTTLTVRAVLLCLTICQFGVAEAQPVTTGKRLKVKAPARVAQTQTKAARPAPQKVVVNEDPMQEPQDDVSRDVAPIRSSYRQTKLDYNESWLDNSTSVLMPVPKARMVILSVSGDGVTGTSKVNGTASGYNISANSKVSSVGTSLNGYYGFTDHFYIGAKYSYMPSESTTDYSIPYSPLTKNTSKSEGFSEPSILIGATGEIVPSTRVIAELSGSVPVGMGHRETKGQDSTSNGLSGGSDMGPSLGLVSSIGPVKLIGMTSYRFALEKKSENVTDGIKTNSTTTDGNVTSLNLAMELPSLYNLGIGTMYSKYDSTTTKSDSQNLVTSTSYSKGYQNIAGLLYMAVPVESMNTVFSPRLAYSTDLGETIDNGLTSKTEAWFFSLAAIVHF